MYPRLPSSVSLREHVNNKPEVKSAKIEKKNTTSNEGVPKLPKSKKKEKHHLLNI
jgi:hypothetical protein